MLLLAAGLALTPVTVEITTPAPEGVMYVQLCSRQTFMTSHCPHRDSAEAASEMSFLFENIPPGEWAVMVWRDPESDGVMRRGMFGVPQEPTAISRAPRAVFGPPRFDDAKLEIGAEPVSVRISID